MTTVAAAVAGQVAASMTAVVDTAVARTWAEVPGYALAGDASVRHDVELHVTAVFRAVVQTLLERRAIEPSDFASTPEQAGRRYRQGVPLGDMLAAFRLNQVVLWTAIGDAARGHQQGAEEAILMAAHVMDAFEMSTAICTQAYVDEQRRGGDGRNALVSSTVEDLIGGRPVTSASGRALTDAAGLRSGSPAVVAVVRPLLGLFECQSDLTSSVAAAFGSSTIPLVTMREGEVVVVVHQQGTSIRRLVSRVDALHRRWALRRVPLSIGISTVLSDAGHVPVGYQQARTACDRLGEHGGVLALPLVSPLEFLLLRDTDEARRLIPPRHRRFVEDELARDRTLIDTVTVFAECDLNATETAIKLNLHSNTIYYRLDRVAERTGADPRHLRDLVDLTVAIRLLGGERDGWRRQNETRTGRSPRSM